ncbi:cytochrome c [Pelagibius litoralis]|uniref:Cytochrome c n=1 Tax=Pelagibius litoralis TaxID=374515 RepID=A0A967F0R8_9PROT|nr:cytochrome c [Pelagibius litoralis]NIA70892.1 cytochrome c [Pelagibius litoralis]
MLRKTIFAAAGAFAITAGALLVSDNLVRPSHADGHGAKVAAVKERQEAMKAVGGNMKIIAEFVKDSKGSAAEAAAAARKIGEIATAVPDVFKVEATLEEMDTVGKNRAKPNIWSDWDGFLARGKVLEEESAKMASALDGGDAGAIQTQFGAFGKEGCGGCHETYRGPKVDG